MLIVPPGWWHHVYSLDLSVSVNIWSPNNETDPIHREKEAMTRIIGKICTESGHVNAPSLDPDWGNIERLMTFLI